MQRYSASSPTGFKVIGYQTDYSGSIDAIEFDKLTHVNYAFLLPDDSGDGSLQPLRNPDQLHDLVQAGHANGVPILISAGGWNDGNDLGFERLAAAEESTERFVNNMIDFVATYQLDGIDIDWEYPGPKIESARNYANLMRRLSAAMHERGKLLTTAVVALGETGSGVLDEVFDYVDFLNIMAYDASYGVSHSPFHYAQQSLNYWLDRGVPREKAVLGVPFYGRPAWASYKDLVAADPTAADKDEISYKNRIVHYNGIATMRAKTELALRSANGIMMWELAEDTHDETSLLHTIHNTISQHLESTQG